MNSMRMIITLAAVAAAALTAGLAPAGAASAPRVPGACQQQPHGTTTGTESLGDWAHDHGTTIYATIFATNLCSNGDTAIRLPGYVDGGHLWRAMPRGLLLYGGSPQQR